MREMAAHAPGCESQLPTAARSHAFKLGRMDRGRAANSWAVRHAEHARKKKGDSLSRMRPASHARAAAREQARPISTVRTCTHHKFDRDRGARCASKATRTCHFGACVCECCSASAKRSSPRCQPARAQVSTSPDHHLSPSPSPHPPRAHPTTSGHHTTHSLHPHTRRHAALSA